MDIRNVTEFRNFITANALTSIHGTFGTIEACVRDYEHGCDCWKKGEKDIMYNNCNLLYRQAVGIISSSLKDKILTYVPGHKLRFYQDGHLIGEVK